ncbi:putative C-S lyase [Photobacterium sanctipauli]|uniref:cysteine-S-conjugate beta-lyase n=1 Tax=Photobacterium sanctipauli TaxID=1342794 RepID=A0A2T3P0N1_9GAMM|nr:PatB family C-S lyase [Photobacterium sanctipauli]PSW22084.1 putative C-S lyase [Photobacterium sanctipauli]
MFKVSPQVEGISNKFIKHDSNMLNQIYGTDDLVPYWVADMDFPIANPITNELARLVEREVYSYEFNSSNIFQAISNWNRDRHGLQLNPENFAQVPGVLSAIALLIREFSNEGEGVLIQTPVYHQFRRLIESAGRKAVNNTLKLAGERYEMDFADFEQKLKNDSVKIVLLCNPHNPVGRVWTADELRQMAEIAAKYDVVVISDEVHADIVFDDHQFNSILATGYESAISIIGSPAKNFGLNSISNGYIYSDNEAYIAKIKAASSSMALDHGNAFTTFATIAAYEKGQEWFEGFLTYTQNNVDWVVGYVAEHMPQIKVFKPEGTNQIWFDFSGLGLAPEPLKSLLAKEAKIGLTPGTWFGEPNENYYRINVASPLEQLQASFERLKAAVDQI